jgi:small subunit ribosomal protein S16
MEVNSDRAQYWLGVGAQPTAAVEAIFKVTGDWQKFKGLPGTEGTLRFATPKPAKSIAYEAAVKQAMDEPKEGATTMKKKAQEKLAAKANPAPVIEEAVVSEVVAEAPAEVVAEVSEPTATDVVAEVSEPTATDVVAEVPVEVTTTDVVVETEEAAAE